MNIAIMRRLPVFKTLRRAFELLWIHRWLQLRVALPCFVLLSVAVSLGIHKMTSVPPEKIVDMLQTIPARYAAIWMGVSSVGTIMLMMFSVTWRRYLLLEVRPTSLIFGKPFRHYLVLFVAAYFFVIFGDAVLTQILLIFLQTGIKDPNILVPLGALCMVGALAAIVLFLTRYVLLFTAAAIGDPALKFPSAAAAMKGNVLRYAAAWVLIALAMNFANNFIELLLSVIGLDPATAIGSIVIGGLTGLTMVITASLTASLAALAYDFLVRGGGPADVR